MNRGFPVRVNGIGDAPVGLVVGGEFAQAEHALPVVETTSPADGMHGDPIRLPEPLDLTVGTREFPVS